MCHLTPHLLQQVTDETNPLWPGHLGLCFAHGRSTGTPAGVPFGGGGYNAPGSTPSPADGTANTGGGGGGDQDGPASGRAGGSGIVIVRGPSARTFTVAPGSNSTSTAPGGQKIATFTVSGTLTVT